MAQYRRQVQPVEYVSQFNPAMEQGFQQTLLQAQNRYDNSFGATKEEELRQGELFFLDPDARERTLKNFERQKEEVLKRYNGDYGAASKELANVIVKERSNPVYQMNKYQQQKVSEFEQTLNKIGRQNAIVLKDPTKDLSLYDPKTGKLKTSDQFDYNVAARDDYDKIVHSAGIGIIQTIRDSELMDSKTKEGYIQKIRTSGLATLNDEDKLHIAELIGEKLDKESTLSYDPLYEGVKGKDYAYDAINRLFPSGIEKQVMFDQMEAENRKAANVKTTPSPTGRYSFTDRSLGKDVKTIDPILDAVIKVKERKNDIKNETETISLLAEADDYLTPTLAQKNPSVASLHNSDDMAEKIQFQKYVGIVHRANPKAIEKYFNITQDPNGGMTYYQLKDDNKMFVKDAYNNIDETLRSMADNAEKELSKSNIEDERATLEFEKKYKDVYYPLINSGYSEDDALALIIDAQKRDMFNKTIDTNNEAFRKQFSVKLMGIMPANVTLYDITDEGRYKESKTKVKDLAESTPINVVIDPQEGGVIMTFKDGTRKAIKNADTNLDFASRTYLGAFEEFTKKLNNFEKLEEVVNIVDDGYYKTRYIIERDIKNSLQPIVKYQVLKSDNNSVIKEVPMGIGEVYEELTTKFMHLQGYTSDIKTEQLSTY